MSRVSRSSLWSLCLARLVVAAGGLARVVLIDVRPDVDERHASKLHAVAANLCEKLPGTPVVFFHHSAAAAAAAALARAHACVAATTAVDAQMTAPHLFISFSTFGLAAAVLATQAKIYTAPVGDFASQLAGCWGECDCPEVRRKLTGPHGWPCCGPPPDARAFLARHDPWARFGLEAPHA